MNHERISKPSRREVTAGLMVAAAGLAGTPATAAPPFTARMVTDRIRSRCEAAGVAWQTKTVDTYKIGDPDTPVTGIVSTFMATFEIFQKAAAQKANLIISHEPTFWSNGDDTAAFVNDPVYRAKAAYAKANNLVVFRFHDHWHRLTPEPMSTERIAKLGWERYRDPASPSGPSARYIFPATSLEQFAATLAQRLPSQSLRIVGDPDLKVRRAAIVGHSLAGVEEALADSDVAIVYEARETESVEYVRDLVQLGQKKALLILPHERGEWLGMKRCAAWLRPAVPEVPVTFIPSGEPFRIPRFV